MTQAGTGPRSGPRALRGRLSIKWRITIGTLIVAIVLSTGAVAVFRGQVARILSSTTTTLLKHDAAPYIAEIEANPVNGSDDAPGRGQLVAVLDPSGETRTSSLPHTLESKIPMLSSLGDDSTVVQGGDDTYRVITTTVQTSVGSWHVIAARNEDSATLSLDRITQALIVSAAIIVLAFGLASWLLTSAALRPVTRMRRQARAILAEGSSEPLPTGPARDEIADLAVTLNEFIADVRSSVERERQLVSDASHELRTPLAILMAQLELAHLASGDAAALEAEIVTAQNSVQRISALATGLLELSQLEAGAGDGESGWRELSDELEASVDRSRLLAVRRDITVDYDLGSEATEARYRIATVNFGRLVGNLTTNAINAVPEGGSVRIGMRHSASYLELSVVDSGPGMPEEFIPIAFDRFTRPDESRAQTRRSDDGGADDGGAMNGGAVNGSGSGLGLAIVHAIVTAANGTIVLSNSGGFTVTVSIPAL